MILFIYQRENGVVGIYVVSVVRNIYQKYKNARFLTIKLPIVSFKNCFRHFRIYNHKSFNISARTTFIYAKKSKLLSFEDYFSHFLQKQRKKELSLLLHNLITHFIVRHTEILKWIYIIGILLQYMVYSIMQDKKILIIM